MTATESDLDALESSKIIRDDRWPFGADCPACGRPHMFRYENGAMYCHKCGELLLSAPVGVSASKNSP